MSIPDFAIPEFFDNVDYDLVEYRKGDILSTKDIANDYVIYILQGEARYLFSTLNYPKTLWGDYGGLYRFSQSYFINQVESVIAATKIKAIVINNLIIRKLLRQGVSLLPPTSIHLKYPIEQSIYCRNLLAKIF